MSFVGGLLVLVAIVALLWANRRRCRPYYTYGTLSVATLEVLAADDPSEHPPFVSPETEAFLDRERRRAAAALENRLRR